ncbi:hypothetical protein MJ1_0635 [Nanobdella aerobiophila]|uniref:Uncharacterized protein n=1 Tax=Nanobdella aerobiophila TaxID=2586965 RepID=A0A915SFI8_9ARCH|nr:hypothetical protein MJ1_0635 [Nanobdella aerobiophila]
MFKKIFPNVYIFRSEYNSYLYVFKKIDYIISRFGNQYNYLVSIQIILSYLSINNFFLI